MIHRRPSSQQQATQGLRITLSVFVCAAKPQAHLSRTQSCTRRPISACSVPLVNPLLYRDVIAQGHASRARGDAVVQGPPHDQRAGAVTPPLERLQLFTCFCQIVLTPSWVWARKIRPRFEKIASGNSDTT